MGMPEWSEEANRLLDAWASAQAEIRRLHRVAEKHRANLTEANDRCRDARAKFDNFMHGCMSIRADGLAAEPIDATAPTGAP